MPDPPKTGPGRPDQRIRAGRLEPERAPVKARILFSSGTRFARLRDRVIAIAEMLEEEESQGLGLFVRSLIGLDRSAAKEAFAGFLQGRVMTASQIEFIDLIINHLTEHGVMGAALLYESPFTDIAPHGPDDLFTSDEVDRLVTVLDRVRAAAAA